jgi:hypothetical protein
MGIRTVRVGVLALSLVAATAVPAATATTADDVWLDAVGIDRATVEAVDYRGHPDAVGVLNRPLGGLPTAGGDYLVLSTGRVADVLGDDVDVEASTAFGVGGGVTGNDLSQLTLTLTPPSAARCLAFDFVFISEEYPNFVGSQYNDIFTAELNESRWDLDTSTSLIASPNNFAYDPENNIISVNTLFEFTPIAGTVFNGGTPPLTARTPVETDVNTGTMDLILSIQDVGDDVLDSAVLLDNFRWVGGANCARGADSLVDSDGDGLPDVWESEGIDYTGDGNIDIDLPAMGADPNRKDLFIQVDWMVREPKCLWKLCWGGRSFEPNRAALDDVVAAFAAAPVDNPDGTTGITVHIDAGPDSVMDPTTGARWGDRSAAGPVAHTSSLGSFVADGRYDWTAFDALKEVHFPAPRRDVFHYALYADTYGGSGSSGISRGLPGSDFLVTDGHSSWGSSGFTRTQERGTFMHELGHNLDLMHGGDRHEQRGTDYRSIMNYHYQLVGLPGARPLDYSRSTPVIDWNRLRFDGGSIGDLGDTAPLPQLTEPDSITVDIARELDAYASDGDGTVDIVGPSLVLTGTGDQHLLVDVTNVGDATATYELEVASDVVEADTVEVSLNGHATERVHLPVRVVGAAGTDGQVTVTLTDPDGTELHRGVAELFVVDLAEEADDAADALDALAGVDDELDDELRALLTDLLAGDEPIDPDPSRPTPPSCRASTSMVFPDVDRNDVHATNIGCAAALELVRGKEDGRFDPLGRLTRGQAASILARSLVASNVALPAVSGAGPFVDVAGDTHRTAIVQLAELGVVEGRTATTFEPGAPVTRGQLASLLERASRLQLAGYPPVDGPRFADIAGSVHQTAIDRLHAADIVAGLRGGTSFGPQRPVTRAQTASLVVRWLNDQHDRHR